MECAHFVDGLLRRPAFERNSVSSDKHAAAVATQPAVDEDSSARALQNQIKKPRHLFIFWGCPAGVRKIDEAHPEGFCAVVLILDEAMQFAAEVNNGINAELLSFSPSLLGCPPR
jgi:hypothetical protein